MKNLWTLGRSLFPYVSVVLIVICLFRFLLLGQLFESDDYELHAARAANYYLALQQGQFPPRWAPNLSDGFGYPVFNYTYPLPYITSSLLHTLGLSIQASLLLSVLAACIFAALAAFQLAREFVPQTWCAVLIACAYLANPYTFLQVYWRGALGEIFLSSLVPAALLSCYYFIKYYRLLHMRILTSTLLGVIGAAAILSHVPSLLALGIVLLAWLCILVIDRRLPRTYWVSATAYMFYCCLVAVMLSGFYLFPAVGEVHFIAYKESSSLLQYKGHLLPAWTFIDITRTILKSPYFEDVVQLGISICSTIVLVGYVLIRSKRAQTKWVLLIVATTGAITFFLMTLRSQPLWDHSSLLQIIQFPWRLLWVLNALSFIAALFLTASPARPRLRLLLMASLAVGVVVTTSTYGFPRSSFSRNDYEWYESVILGSSYDEHRPVGALRSYPLSDPIIYQAEATLNTPASTWSSITRENPAFTELTGTRMVYHVTFPSPTVVIHKRLAFPGWHIDIDGKTVEPGLYSSTYKGLLQIQVPTGSHVITVSFTGTTPVRRMGEVSTLLALVWLCCVAIHTTRHLIPNPIHFPLRIRNLK